MRIKHAPVLKTFVGFTNDSNSFKNIDLVSQYEIPYDQHVGAFGVQRTNHIHEGLDIYGLQGDIIFSMFDGEIVAISPFTGEDAGSPWWLPTQAIYINSGGITICYGEITPARHLRVGSQITAGMRLGHMERVLKVDKGRPTCMLHIETYEMGVTNSCGIWEIGSERPHALLDPLECICLENIAQLTETHGPVYGAP